MPTFNTSIAGTTSGSNIQLSNVILDVYSDEILFQAQPMLRFEQIAVKKTDLQTLPGQKIKFLKYNALTGDATLTETNTMGTSNIGTTTLAIIVGEYGYAVGFSEALLRASVTDLLKDASTLLGNHYAKFRDGLIRDQLVTGATNVLYANEKASRAQLVATDTFSVDLIRDTVELLATNKAPKYQGQDYITFVHPHQAKWIRRDQAWVQVNLYADPTKILNGEIGKIEDMRFIETTQIPYVAVGTQNVWTDGAQSTSAIYSTTALAANNNTNVYQAVAVGDYAIGVADALPVEMRDDGVIDFGRTHRIGWYGIFGASVLETGFSTILETA
jgi:N4-gp56 family major capsid protein